MASWGAMIILAGFSFDATRGHIGFAPRVQRDGVFRSFWSGANAYGTVELGEGQAQLRVLGGELHLQNLGLPVESGPVAAMLNGENVVPTSSSDSVSFASLRLCPGDALDLRAPGLSLRALPDLATL
jgi:hypothetical protein